MNMDSRIRDCDSFQERLRRTVVRIRDSIGVERQVFQEMLGMTASRYSTIVMQRDEFTIQELQSLANAVALDLDLLLQGHVDYSALAQQFRGDRSILPERYAEKTQRFGRAKAAQVIFAHLSAYHGEEFGRAYFRRFQLQPETFENAADFIHPLISIDLIGEFTKEGYSEAQIRSVGTMTFGTSPPQLRRQLAGMKDPRALYAYFLEGVIPLMYDRMSEYQITRLTSTGCTVVTRTREEAQNSFGRAIIDSRETCLYRQGVFSSVLGHLRTRFGTIHETTCIHRGDAQCTIEVTWN